MRADSLRHLVTMAVRLGTIKHRYHRPIDEPAGLWLNRSSNATGQERDELVEESKF
jgi:hypothetical protein